MDVIHQNKLFLRSKKQRERPPVWVTIICILHQIFLFFFFYFFRAIGRVSVVKSFFPNLNQLLEHDPVWVIIICILTVFLFFSLSAPFPLTPPLFIRVIPTRRTRAHDPDPYRSILQRCRTVPVPPSHTRRAADAHAELHGCDTRESREWNYTDVTTESGHFRIFKPPNFWTGYGAQLSASCPKTKFFFR